MPFFGPSRKVMTTSMSYKNHFIMSELQMCINILWRDYKSRCVELKEICLNLLCQDDFASVYLIIYNELSLFNYEEFFYYKNLDDEIKKKFNPIFVSAEVNITDCMKYQYYKTLLSIVKNIHNRHSKFYFKEQFNCEQFNIIRLIAYSINICFINNEHVKMGEIKQNNLYIYAVLCLLYTSRSVSNKYQFDFYDASMEIIFQIIKNQFYESTINPAPILSMMKNIHAEDIFKSLLRDEVLMLESNIPNEMILIANIIKEFSFALMKYLENKKNINITGSIDEEINFNSSILSFQL